MPLAFPPDSYSIVYNAVPPPWVGTSGAGNRRSNRSLDIMSLPIVHAHLRGLSSTTHTRTLVRTAVTTNMRLSLQGTPLRSNAT